MKDSALTLTGGAAASLNNGNPVVKLVPSTILSPGECDENEFSVLINTCRPSFNYEVNIKTNDEYCRAYFFERQMKSLCKANGTVDCTLKNPSSGATSKCQLYEGPKLVTIKKANCPEITCIDQTPASCRQDITYDFEIKNFNDQEVKFDQNPPQVANSKVAWKIVEDNKKNFADLGPGGNSKCCANITQFDMYNSVIVSTLFPYNSFPC